MTTLKDLIIPDYDKSISKGRKIIKEWKRTKTRGQLYRLAKPGNFVLITYKAKTQDVYDKNPVLIVLRRDKKYTFGLNVNHLNKKRKEKLIQSIKNANLVEKKQRNARTRFFRFMCDKYHYPKIAYRLYFSKEIKKHPIYPLDFGDLFTALTHNLRNKNTKKRK